ncbi:putative coiled-coil domain-containing protein 144C [Phalacrocorax carbo]|uniref:putative coiled-coil domain-containing protein 144C n=1 Tax=Phalacrocorax carbo TaxID=9209 RepID=UPI00311A1369
MKRWWFLRRRRAQEGPPVSSGSGGGDQLQMEGRDELRPEAVMESKSSGGQAEDVRAQMLKTAGLDSSLSHPSPGSHQTSENVDVQMLIRKCEQWLREHERISQVLQDNKSLSQQLSKAERKARRLEKEVEQLKKALWEKALALDMTERELRQAQKQAKERHALHLEKDQERKDAVKKAEGLQEQLAQLQSENHLLRQQLGDVNKSTQIRMRTVGQLHRELADACQKQWIAETSLKAATRQCDYLKQENSHLQEDLHKAKAELCDLSARLELESQNALHLEAANQELQGLVALLPHRLATPGVGHPPTALHGGECEQRAQEETREKQHLGELLQTQAAAQAKTEEANTTDASWRKLLEQRMKAQELDLERARSLQEATALQLALVQAELKSSEKRYLAGRKIRSCLSKKLKKANETLAEASAESRQEQQRRLVSRKAKSLSQSRGQSGNPSGSVTGEHETGSAGDSPWMSPALPPN